MLIYFLDYGYDIGKLGGWSPTIPFTMPRNYDSSPLTPTAFMPVE